MATVQQRLSTVSLATISQREIAMLETDPEKNLGRVLDSFLTKIDIFDNPQLFKLFQQLGEKVNEQDLPALAEKIASDKPTGMDRVKMALMSSKARQAYIAEMWEKLRGIASGKSQNLVEFVKQLERQLQTEQQKLDREITALEDLKAQYQQSFREFVVSVAFMQLFVEQAKMYVEYEERAADLTNPIENDRIRDLKDKLQALESRAIALEGTLTRLPADQLVIRQLQNAGIQTLQETTTTATQRFNSIKMTLVTLNSTLIAKSVQQLAQQGAELDANLLKVRGTLMQGVVTTAANAPGDNRLEQARQIEQIVADTKAMQQIVEDARTTNAQKFGQARQSLEKSREELLMLGQSVQPNSALRR